MHELSFVFQIISSVQKISIEQKLEAIEAIVLEIGSFSSIIPETIYEYFQLATKDTFLENTKLTIEIILAKGECRSCSKIYEVNDFDSICPNCESKNFLLISGQEFIIKELLVH